MASVVAGITSYGSVGLGDQLSPLVRQVPLAGTDPAQLAAQERDWVCAHRPDWCIFSYPGVHDPYDLPSDVRTASIIYDIQQTVFPDNFEPVELWSRDRAIRLAVDHADLLLTISGFSASEIRRVYPEVFAKVCVIFGGGEKSDGPRFVDSDGSPYLLYPANFWPHKNHASLLEAFRILRRREPSLRLLLTGGDPAAAPRELQAALKQPGVEVLGYVSKERLVGLLKEAACLVYPSLYEGFGMPVLEALEVETPVACSRHGSLPEVGGDVVEYFDAGDPSDIAEAVGRARLKRRDPEWAVGAALQASKYTFAHSADLLWEGMEKAASGSTSQSRQTSRPTEGRPRTFWDFFPNLSAILLPVDFSEPEFGDPDDFVALNVLDLIRLNPLGLCALLERGETLRPGDGSGPLSTVRYRRTLSLVASGKLVILRKSGTSVGSPVPRLVALQCAFWQWRITGRTCREAVRATLTGRWQGEG